MHIQTNQVSEQAAEIVKGDTSGGCLLHTLSGSDAWFLEAGSGLVAEVLAPSKQTSVLLTKIRDES